MQNVKFDAEIAKDPRFDNELQAIIAEYKEEIKKGGFLLCHWDGTPETEERIKEETKATIRCIPLEDLPGHKNEPGTCMVTGKPSAGRVVFAIAY